MSDLGRQPHNDSSHFWLTVAVTGTMVVVVGAWLWLLPYQLRSQGYGGSDNGDWDTVRAGLDEQAAEFKSSLDALSNGLGSVSLPEDVRSSPEESEIGTAGLDPEEVTKRLQEKLAATAQEGSSDGDPTEEQPQ